MLAPWHGSCCWVCVGWAALGHPEAGALSPSPVCKGVNSFFPSQLQQQLLASQYQFHRLPLPALLVKALSGLFFGKVSIWKRVQALPDAPYLHTDAHPTPTVPWFFEVPTPAGHRSALQPAQIYPLFYIHTPLIFTALLEQYPGLLITPGPPPPPMCIHHAPTKVPSVSRG